MLRSAYVVPSSTIASKEAKSTLIITLRSNKKKRSRQGKGAVQVYPVPAPRFLDAVRFLLSWNEEHREARNIQSCEDKAEDDEAMKRVRRKIYFRMQRR